MQAAKTVKGWDKKKPKTDKDREKVKRACGPGAFLAPGELKYPIVGKSGGCAVDCRGLRAAKARAAQHGRKDLVAKADRLARQVGCRWATA